jgi:hypothetical protein
MQYAEFETIDPEYAGIFMKGRTYQMLEPRFYTPDVLADIGPCQLEVLLKDEQTHEVYSLTADFASGVGAESGLDALWVEVSAVSLLSVDGDAIAHSPMDFERRLLLRADASNVLSVDTEVSTLGVKAREMADDYIKTTLTR